MSNRIGTLLAACAFAAALGTAAFAGGGGDEPAPATGEKKPACEGKKDGDCGPCKGGAAGECKDAGPCKEGASCGDEAACKACAEGAKDCAACKEKVAKGNAMAATVAALEGQGEAAKKVLAAVPEESRKKVEEAGKATFEFLVKVHREVTSLRKECAALEEKAKAEGKEPSCEVKATLENDVKTLCAKAHEKIDGFGKVLAEAVGAEKFQALAADLPKAEIHKAFMARVEAASSAPAKKDGDCCPGEKKDGDADCGKKDDGCCPGGKKPEKNPQ